MQLSDPDTGRTLRLTLTSDTRTWFGGWGGGGISSHLVVDERGSEEDGQTGWG